MYDGFIFYFDLLYHTIIIIKFYHTCKSSIVHAHVHPFLEKEREGVSLSGISRVIL